MTSTFVDEPTLVLVTHEYVKEYMSKFDSSHDYSHILRVLALSQQILAATQRNSPHTVYNSTLVTLLALLHDIGDKKYLTSPSSSIGLGPVEEFLISAGCAPDLAATVQELVSNVSYSHERENPDRVARAIAKHPELAIVQDADRLDAIGAVGIGRTFTYGASRNQGKGMSGVMDHFEDKLVKLGEGMKTAEGKRLGKERGERIVMFMQWWEEEVGGASGFPV